MTRLTSPRRLLAGVGITLGTALCVVAPTAHAADGPTWVMVNTGVTSHYRGLSVVDRNTVWLGGYDGIIMRTVDGGAHWQNVSPQHAGRMQFRDISAFSATHAVAMAAGPRLSSRLYTTWDGGLHWQLAYQNTDPAAFFDCMSFFDYRHGLVVSDPVGGKFRILSTTDGGMSWQVLPNGGMPAALDGEAAFAASGECLTTLGKDAWLASGGGSSARVFHSSDGGFNWTVSNTPIMSSPSAGIMGITASPTNGVVITGGDFADPAENRAVAARTVSGNWVLSTTQPGGYRSGVTWMPMGSTTLVAVGLNGSDISTDKGQTWTTFDSGQFDTVACPSDGGACWASGDQGRVARFVRGLPR